MSLSKILLSVALVALLNPLSGQKEFNKADKLLGLKAYDLAIKSYEAGLVKHPDNARGHAQIAEAYRMTNQLLNALKSYERAFSLSEDLDALYRLNYAHTLKKVGLYEQAEAWYTKALTDNPAEAAYFLSSTDFAKSLLQKPDKYDLLSFEANSEESDFGVALFRDKIIFSSFRTDMERMNEKKNDSYFNRKGNQLFVTYATGNTGGKEIRFLRPDTKEVYGLGPVSYSEDGETAVYTKNTFTSGSNQIVRDEADMSLYIGKASKDGDFIDVTPFPYNNIAYSCAFAHISNMGSALYFASNQPGGMGGFDLYVSFLKDGKWSDPENLGPEVNTKGNEVSPYFLKDRLYFASDYHMGLGGYDIFVSEIVAGKWARVENMGKGINSPSDDYYFVPDTENDRYFLTSNRLGGRGKDDIYVAYPMTVIEEDIPLAVDLNQLKKSNSGDLPVPMTEAAETSPSVVTVGEGETVIINEVADEPTIFADKVTIEDIYFDFDGATLVSVDENYEKKKLDKNAEVFFIQLASLSRSKGQLGYYSDIIAYGSLYRFFKPNSVKIRLGYYRTRAEAADVLNKVKMAGFRDAFVTADVLGISEYELLKHGQSPRYDIEEFINEYSTSSQYKVKLASYLNPMGFNVEAAKGMGRLEQWSKGRWTIFVLGGFESYEAAEAARIRAVNKGFADAELVLDDGGILRKVRTD